MAKFGKSGKKLPTHLEGENPVKDTDIEGILAEEKVIFALPPIGAANIVNDFKRVTMYYLKNGRLYYETIKFPDEAVEALRENSKLYRLVW